MRNYQEGEIMRGPNGALFRLRGGNWVPVAPPPTDPVAPSPFAPGASSSPFPALGGQPQAEAQPANSAGGLDPSGMPPVQAGIDPASEAQPTHLPTWFGSAPLASGGDAPLPVDGRGMSAEEWLGRLNAQFARASAAQAASLPAYGVPRAVGPGFGAAEQRTARQRPVPPPERMDRSTRVFRDGSADAQQISTDIGQDTTIWVKDPTKAGVAAHANAMLRTRIGKTNNFKYSDNDFLKYALANNGDRNSILRLLKFRKDNPDYKGGYNTQALENKQVPVTARQQIFNDVANSGPGSAAIGAFDTVDGWTGHNIVGSMADADIRKEIMEGAKDEHPWWFAGGATLPNFALSEVGGGLLTSAALRIAERNLIAQGVAPMLAREIAAATVKLGEAPLTARVLASPYAANITVGAATGALGAPPGHRLEEAVKGGARAALSTAAGHYTGEAADVATESKAAGKIAEAVGEHGTDVTLERYRSTPAEATETRRLDLGAVPFATGLPVAPLGAALKRAEKNQLFLQDLQQVRRRSGRMFAPGGGAGNLTWPETGVAPEISTLGQARPIIAEPASRAASPVAPPRRARR
jgi:hypothetical protein